MNVITVENVVKSYKNYETKSAMLKSLFTKKKNYTEFLALKDINLQIEKGEVVGLIGENGAGKSTLLKLISNTIKPTTGKINVVGRTVSLLELGTGFNIELSGRENIYLNCYLLGMKRIEIQEKTGAIIEFAEIGDFIDKPVKTYSTGMFVRLAFSIATTVEPDILVVDEALSVGDEYFQKKCIDRMNRFKKEGRTILFCSHSMYHIKELCSRAVWLKDGEIELDGHTDYIVESYQNYMRDKYAKARETSNNSVTDSIVKFKKVKMFNGEGEETYKFSTFDDIIFEFTVSAKNMVGGHVGVVIHRNDQELIFGTTSKVEGIDFTFKDGEKYKVTLKKNILLTGIYNFTIALVDDSGLMGLDYYVFNGIKVNNKHGQYGIAMCEIDWDR